MESATNQSNGKTLQVLCFQDKFMLIQKKFADQIKNAKELLVRE